MNKINVLEMLLIPVSTHISAVPPNNFESIMIPIKEPLMQAMKPRLDKFL